MRTSCRPQRGQTLTETVIWAPLFFTTAFFALQICHLGLAAVMTHYAAASISRKVVEDVTLYDSLTANGGRVDLSQFQPDFEKLCTAGMKFGQLYADSKMPDGNFSTGPVGSVRVTAYSKLRPFPMMNLFVGPIIQQNGARSEDDDYPCIGFVCFERGGQGYFFIRGRAYARLNYH